MRILLDNNLHIDLTNEFPGHIVEHCRDLGWQLLSNGELVRVASERFDILITVDKNMRHQTNLSGVDIAVVIFDAKNNRIDELRRFIPRFLERMNGFSPGHYSVI